MSPRDRRFEEGRVHHYIWKVDRELRWNRLAAAEHISRVSKLDCPDAYCTLTRMIREKRFNAILRSLHGPGVEG